MSGTTFDRDDTAQSALGWRRDTGTLTLNFAAAGANPIVWTEILRFDSTGRPSTGSVNRFRYLQSMARVTRTGLSLPDATLTFIGFDTESFDTDGLHDNVTNNSRLTAVVPGKYRVTGRVIFPSDPDGQRVVEILKNGASLVPGTEVRVGASAGGATTIGVSDLVSLVATDFLEVRAYQNSGGALLVSADFSLIYEGE